MELSKKENDFRQKLKEIDAEVHRLKEQAQPLADKVFAVEKLIEERGKNNKSERLQKELGEERSKLNTIQGKARQVQTARQKIQLQHKTALDKVCKRLLAQRTLNHKVNTTIEEQRLLRTAVDEALHFVKEGGDLEIDARFPQDLAAAINSVRTAPSVARDVSDDHDARRGGGLVQEQEDSCDDILEQSLGENKKDHNDLQKNENDFRTDPNVWIRRCEMAMRANSPRWRNRILEETRRWELLSGVAPKERKRDLDEDVREARESPHKRIKSPCTKTYTETHAIAAANYETSFLERMKANCVEDWQQDFLDRMLLTKSRDHRANWFDLGLPCDATADFARLREIRKDRQHPSPAGYKSATLSNALQHTAVHCNTQQRTAAHCSALQRTATHCNALQHTATHCNTLQRTATHCNALQHTATHCNAH